jgi:hypothetical protein
MNTREHPAPEQVPREPSIEELKAMLEAQLDQQVGPPYRGCWPLLVALLGIALAVGLLLLQ